MSLSCCNDEDVCIVCQNPLPPRAYDRVNRKLYICCGKEACLPCTDAIIENSKSGKIQCPNSNCGKPIPHTKEERFVLAQQMVDANETCYWAQNELANMYLNGADDGIVRSDCVANEGRFVDLMTLAADRRHHYAPAQISLGQYYYRQLTESSGGGHPPFAKCDAFEHSRELYLLAKDNKHLSANLLLGSLFHAVGDDAESIRYYKLGAEAGCNESSYYVGVYYQEVEKSWDLAIPCFERAAKNGRPDAQFALSQALMQQAKKQYMSWEIPGKSPVPRAMFWARRAVATEEESLSPSSSSNGLAHYYLTQMINLMRIRCAGCDAIDEDGFEKKCSKCKASFYCSKECQKRHWRAGHKTDCCDAYY